MIRFFYRGLINIDRLSPGFIKSLDENVVMEMMDRLLSMIISQNLFLEFLINLPTTIISKVLHKYVDMMIYHLHFHIIKK